MNREIKYRVYVEFELDGVMHKAMEEPSSYYLLTQTGKLWVYGPMERPSPLPDYVKKAIPLFYTGLLDKNGVEIYEGDVLRKDDPTYWEENEHLIMAEDLKYWSGGTGYVIRLAFGFDIEEIKCGEWAFNGPEGSEWSGEEVEVIGNIYQNPELLKGSNVLPHNTNYNVT